MRIRTYEQFAKHWPHAGPDEQVFAEPLRTRPKYVATTTLQGSLDWERSEILDGDVAVAVAALK